jgi:ABC-type transport system involved in multi-copper enzyme maturation permease subunit
MLSQIIQKELRENLLNLRFVAACAISIVLIVITIVTLTSSYKTALADYNSGQIAQEDFISHYAHLNRWNWMSEPLRPPARYSFLVEGIDREAQQKNFVSDPLPVLFSQIDLVSIVTIIMNLMAILFSYNAISGEREAGVLKQMLSTNIPRSTILVGKFLGGSISLLIPFTLGLLAGLVFVAASPAVQLRTVDVGVFCLLLLASCLYISAFYGIGLFFSARSRSSNVAVLKSLFAWVILVLMLPNVSPFLAADVYRIPSKTQIDMETWQLQGQERDDIIEQRTKELRQTKYADIAADLLTTWDVESQKLVRRAATDPVFRERYEQYKKDWTDMVREVNTSQQEKVKQVRHEFEQRSKHQEWLATVFASTSPLADYVFMAADLAEVGIQADDEWDKQQEQFNATLAPILEKKYDDEIKKNPAFSYNDFIDMRDVPRFQFQSPRMMDKLEAALPHLGVLALFNLLFLVGAWVSFLRYDVR